MGNNVAYEYLNYGRAKDRAKVVRLIGPFAMDRSVHKALGLPITSTDQHTWVIATINGEVAGFGAIILGGDKAQLAHAYVVEEHRDSGIGKELLQRRIDVAKDRKCKAATTTDLAGKAVYKDLGFTENPKKGSKYSIYTLTIGGDDGK